MPRNGTGTYALPAGNPVVAGTTISETWANTTLTDIATGLTNSLAADGQTVVTANLPMNGFKFTGLANGSSAQDSVTKAQLDLKADLAGPTFTTSIGFDSNYALFKGRFSSTNVAERTMFQTVTTNGATNVGVIPNGTAQTASFQAFSQATILNTARMVAGIDGSAVAVKSDRVGTGTYLPLELWANGAVQWGIETDGRVYGSNLHNVGTVTGTTKQYLASGTYTPTVSAAVNTTTSFPAKAQWTRVGNVVQVAGGLALTPTATATETSFKISLPIASDIAAVEDLNGSGSVYIAGANALGMVIQGDAATDTATVSFRSPTVAGACSITFVFMYEIL